MEPLNPVAKKGRGLSSQRAVFRAREEEKNWGREGGKNGQRLEIGDEAHSIT